MELLHEVEFWVSLSFVAFVALTFKPIAGFIVRALDARGVKIASELQEATRLRTEAEQVLAEYKRRQTEVVQEANAILAKTRADADQIAQNAQAELQALLEKHTRGAKEKIAQAETKAIQEVRNHMVDVAISAARAIMRDYLAKGGSNELLKAAASEIERKLH